MDDIVAVEVLLDTGEKSYFITWGRIQDKVDPAPLEALVLRHCTRFGLGGKPICASVCLSLQAASKQPYFYEGLFNFCQKKIPFGTGYECWRKKTAERMAAGKDLYYLGQPDAK